MCQRFYCRRARLRVVASITSARMLWEMGSDTPFYLQERIISFGYHKYASTHWEDRLECLAEAMD